MSLDRDLGIERAIVLEILGDDGVVEEPILPGLVCDRPPDELYVLVEVGGGDHVDARRFLDIQEMDKVVV